MYCCLVLSVLFIHRRLHKCIFIESFTRPTWPHLFSLVLEFSEEKVLICNDIIVINIFNTVNNFIIIIISNAVGNENKNVSIGRF